MVHIIIWILIIALFILSFIGVVYPVIPSVLLLWIGFLLYQFGINGEELGVIFWIIMVVFTIILFAADILANNYFVKKFGGSKWGERGALVAVIIGAFIMPPFGIIVIPFLAVLVIEMIQKRTMKEAFRAALGSLLGFLSGSFAKVFVQFVIILIFLFSIIF